MDGVIIISPRGYRERLEARIPDSLRAESTAEGTLVLSDGRSRAYLCFDDDVRDELTDEDLRAIYQIVENPEFHSLEFSDIELCKKLLLLLVDDSALGVDNDHGVVMTGPHFLARIRTTKAWDWRV